MAKWRWGQADEARLLLLSPPGQLRSAALDPLTARSQLLRDDGPTAVLRRRRDPDIVTAPRPAPAAAPAAAAGFVRPTHGGDGERLWAMPGVRTGPAGQAPDSWEGLGGREWVGGLLPSASPGEGVEDDHFAP